MGNQINGGHPLPATRLNPGRLAAAVAAAHQAVDQLRASIDKGDS